MDLTLPARPLRSLALLSLFVSLLWLSFRLTFNCSVHFAYHSPNPAQCGFKFKWLIIIIFALNQTSSYVTCQPIKWAALETGSHAGLVSGYCSAKVHRAWLPCVRAEGGTVLTSKGNGAQ